MNRSRLYYSIVFLTTILLSFSLKGQNRGEWKEIELIDTLAYTSFGVNKLENRGYPPSLLFDGNYKTCWVSKLNKANPPQLFVKMPANASIINVFAGYGKSLDLFYRNSIPKTIKFSIWGCINPDGFVSEIGALYKSVKYPKDTLVYIVDTFGIQSIKLDISQRKLSLFKDSLLQAYDDRFQIPKATFCYILQLEILEEWPGTKYNDICISELFFDDRLVEPKANISIDSIYLNKEENSLMAFLENKGSTVLYTNPEAVLQLGEVSKNRNWVILLSMPVKTEGRAEVAYLLFNLANKEVVNHKLKAYLQDYTDGAPIYFEETKDNRLLLVYQTLEGTLRKVELISR